MPRKLVAKLLISSLTGLAVAFAATATVEGAKSGYSGASVANQSPEISFNLNRLPENPKLYSLVISDTDEHVISGTFSVEQLQILRVMMVEAEKFALTAETVGGKEPITTRFFDKQEAAFLCDVQKTGMESSLFLTLTTEAGRMTLNAGRIIRSTRREQGIFFDLLARLEALLPKLPAPSK
jgi:hypothetical protein